ncbi:MFS transporter [Microbacterium horticulturae]|uniref:MFS transporter n=1 Tax=Microbacterium horticulturae TaxID=3028316 RepID=A0ABY8BZJ7_9MICO|nr:MFS transporter [Microbacterium sp. KACC 23027]WEG08897.1 MFS transporter [Microbacterium sp. KACC 23027]
MTTTTPTIKSGRLITVLAFAGILGALTQTLVVPLIAELPVIFDTSSTNASWIITVTLLTGAVATPIVGRLGDMYGKKKILLIALVPMLIGSVVCALAGGVVPMIIGRGLQGIAAGTVPLGISLLHDVLPHEKVHGAVALMSASMGIGGALGLPLAAGVAQYASWRVLFWVVAVLTALTILFSWLIVPRDEARPAASRSFDYAGAVVLAIGVVALLLGVSKGSEWGWASALTLSLLIGSVIVFIVWGWWELRTPHRLVDLRATVRRPVLLTNLASVLVGFAMYAQSLVIPQLMQLPAETGYGHGQTMLQMGLWMAPMGLGMMAVSPLGGRVTRRYGAKTTLVIGSIIIALGYGASTLVTGSLVGLMLTSTLASAGVGFAYGAMPALIMATTPAKDKAAANGFNSLMRSFGTTASAAVLGVVLAQLSTPLGEYTVPTLAGIRISLLIGCGVAVVAAVLAAFTSSRKSVVASAERVLAEASDEGVDAAAR